MLFVIIGHDGPNGAALRPSVRPAHLENLKPLVDRGQMIIGGPFTDGTGSLMIADFVDEAAALAFAHSDPYLTQGVFERV
ncbi:MAG TPA: YciI family protein, partial [Candidatus Binataceae bacterium]|nr:YciI family protein [Candidatus Binataceae bacterium]